MAGRVLRLAGRYRLSDYQGSKRRTRFIGSVVYYVGGFFIAAFYGWVVLSLMRFGDPPPQLDILPGLPVEIDLFHPLLGIALGLGHGILAAFFAVIFFIEHHPLEQYRSRFILVISQLISHIAFGVVVTFFQRQLLQLLLRGPG